MTWGSCGRPWEFYINSSTEIILRSRNRRLLATIISFTYPVKRTVLRTSYHSFFFTEGFPCTSHRPLLVPEVEDRGLVVTSTKVVRFSPFDLIFHSPLDGPSISPQRWSYSPLLTSFFTLHWVSPPSANTNVHITNLVTPISTDSL